MIVRPILMLPLLALVYQPVLAQFLYKSTMPDGKVIYGDAPIPGATKVEKTRPDTSRKGITASTPNEQAALKKMEAERAAGSAGASNAEHIRALEDSLRKMEAGHEKIKEPLEGERIGTAGGGSRLTDAYWDRQKKYDQSMDALRKELDKARAAR